MRHFKHSILIFAILLGLIVLFTGGCGTAAKKPVQPTNPNNQSHQNDISAPMAKVPVNPIDPMEITNKAITEATKVSGVRKASGFVTDKIIYIGLELNENTENQAITIEKNVMDQINSMNSGYAVRVTSDINTVELIKTVGKGTAQGRPFSEFNNEVQAISIRLTPKGSRLLNIQLKVIDKYNR